MTAKSTRPRPIDIVLRDGLVLLAVGGTISILATLLLLILSSFEARREIGEFVSPLIIATLTSALVLMVGGSPYYLNRGKYPGRFYG